MTQFELVWLMVLSFSVGFIGYFSLKTRRNLSSYERQMSWMEADIERVDSQMVKKPHENDLLRENKKLKKRISKLKKSK